MSHAIITIANVARGMHIGKFEAISEQLFDVQPAQFNNTIRWNLGHFISSMDGMLFQRITKTSKLPSGFSDFFKSGTKPSDWTTTPPSKAELIDLMKKQLNDLNETFAARADEKLAEVFQLGSFKFETIGELIGFAVFHETMHATVASDLVKTINHEYK
jgi:hypothetical protein